MILKSAKHVSENLRNSPGKRFCQGIKVSEQKIFSCKSLITIESKMWENNSFKIIYKVWVLWTAWEVTNRIPLAGRRTTMVDEWTKNSQVIYRFWNRLIIASGLFYLLNHNFFLAIFGKYWNVSFGSKIIYICPSTIVADNIRNLIKNLDKTEFV